MPQPGSTTARGYGAAHAALRKQWAPKVARGTVPCARCRYIILPGQPFDLGHDDHDRTKWTGPEHMRCNRAAGARVGNRKRAPRGLVGSEAGRRVVLVCGPPGSGKTTYANSLGLTVYDRDHPQWRNDEAAFKRAIAQLARQPDAQAVVIRAGATRAARDQTAAIIDATDIQVLTVDAATCTQRVIARKRDRPPLRMQIKAVESWWAKYESPFQPASPSRLVSSKSW